MSKSIYQSLAKKLVPRFNPDSDDESSEVDLYDDGDANADSEANQSTVDGNQATSGGEDDGTTFSSYAKDAHAVTAPPSLPSTAGSPEDGRKAIRSAQPTLQSIWHNERTTADDKSEFQSSSMASLVEGSDDDSPEHDSCSTGKGGDGEPDPTNKIEDATDAKSTITTSSSEWGKERMIPKALGDADLFRRLGLRFEEKEELYFLQDELTDEQFANVSSICVALRPEELRKMTHEVLAAVLSGDEQGPRILEAPAVGMNHLKTLSFQCAPDFSSAGLFDENILYDVCPRTGAVEFRNMLFEWDSTASGAAVLEDINQSIPESAKRLGIKDVDAFCEALGYKFNEEHDAKTGEPINTAPLDGWLYADLLNGLRCLMKVFLPATEFDRLRDAQETFLTAIVTIFKSFVWAMEPMPIKISVFLLRMLGQSFRRLFNIAKELEVYSVTGLTFRTTGKVSIQECHDTLKHIVIALLLAVKAMMEMDEIAPSVEAEIIRRQTALASTGMQAPQTSEYSHVKDCCDSISLSVSTNIEQTRESAENQKEKHYFQEKFNEGVDRLDKMGWDPVAARNILSNEYRWTRVKHHADCAWKMLHRGFRATLSAMKARRFSERPLLSRQMSWLLCFRKCSGDRSLVTKMLWICTINTSRIW